LARPGGNVTGFSLLDYGMSGKWLELLKEVAPGLTRVAVFRDAGAASGMGQYGAIQAIAPSFRVELHPVDVHDPGDIDRTITEFARAENSGLIVTSGTQAVVHRNLLISLAARHRLPATYPSPDWARYGGLIAYGADRQDQYRLAAGYVDRIMKGEKPSDLPVQQPAKFELVMNLKTAKSLGLTLPPALLTRANEVIE
jgi:putative ABC transport system substrate-binding protein